MTRPPPTPPLFPSTPLSRPLHPARPPPPLRCTEQPQPLGERRKPPQRVVLPEQQSKLGARREQSVRLGHPSGHPGVHGGAEGGLVASQGHGLRASDPAHGIDPHPHTLAGRPPVSGRSAY